METTILDSLDSIFTGMALLIQGRILFSRVEAVLGTNEIYLEYGNLLTYAGFALVASGIILLFY